MPSSGLRNIGTRQNSGHVNATKKGAGGGSSTPGFHVSFTHGSTSWHTYASNVIIPFGNNGLTGSSVEFDTENRFGSAVSGSGTSAYSYHIPYEGIWTFSMHIYTGWHDTSNDFSFRRDDNHIDGPHSGFIHGQTERHNTDHIHSYTLTIPCNVNDRISVYTYAAESDIHANNNYFAGMMHVA
jgi:hypothetical protein